MSAIAAESNAAVIPAVGRAECTRGGGRPGPAQAAAAPRFAGGAGSTTRFPAAKRQSSSAFASVFASRGEVSMKLIYAIAAALSWLTAPPASAQTAWPQQPVRILVGFTAGTAPDIVGRVLAEKFAASWGRPVLIENIGGAGGNIACNRVAHAPPDGYALVLCGNGSLVIAPRLYTQLNYDPVKDFVP